MTDFNKEAQSIMDTHTKKNADYGDSFHRSFAMCEAFGPGEGLKYATGRLMDKMTRLQNAAYTKNELNYESVEDTLLDLASYALMTLVELKNTKEVL